MPTARAVTRLLLPRSEAWRKGFNQLLSTRPFTISLLTNKDEAAWDDYVRQCPYGSPFHQTAWKNTIEETFGYRPLYLMARDQDRILGVLPLFVIETVLVHRALLSTPFAVYGGALADSSEVQTALKEQVKTIAEALEVDYVELRNAHPEQSLGFSNIHRYVTFTQEIGPNEEKILESIPRKTRYMVRKALKNEFSTTIRPGPTAAFESLYAQSLRRLGTPSFPSKFFASLARNFGAQMDVREVEFQGKVVSSVLTFFFRDQVLPYYGASDPAHNAIAPNNFMYFDLMRWGGCQGYRVFDFGRSKKSIGGSYDFKAHWGMTERELPYEILLVKRKELPNLSPANPVFDLPRKIWQHIPLPVTRTIGPWFIRLVP